MSLRSLALALILVLAACSTSGPEGGNVTHNRREIPPGPGVLTGQDGQWIIRRQ